MLQGKRAIITGSNSGIGLGVAEELAKAGAEVVLNSFTDRAEDHALAADLGKRHGVAARYIAADMSKGADCRALIEKAGGCDILMNNSRHPVRRPVKSFRPRNGTRSLRSASPRLSTAAALPGMRQRLGQGGQHRLGAWADRQPVQIRLYRRQTWRGRTVKDRGTGNRRRASPATRSAPAMC